MADKVNKRRVLKIYWQSNAHWSNSGYGVFTRDLLFRMRDDGWPIAEGAFVGLGGSPITVDGIKCYPGMADPFGSDSIATHPKNFEADVTFAMQDVPNLNPEALQTVKNFIPYVPIDHDPVPNIVLDRLRYAYKIITFSKFGQQELEKKGFTSTLIVEGTDPDIFKPMNQKEMQEMIHLPQDAFIFGMIAANKENPPRKGFQEAIQAFKMFHDRHPEAAFFYHSNQRQPGGFPIEAFAEHLGIKDRFFKMDDYFGTFLADSTYIAKEINAMDCLLHPSMTEGFGLTVIEAGACGKPVIVNDCTSMPEMVVQGKTGEVCQTDKAFFSNQGAYSYFADTDSLYDRMERIWRKVKEKPDKVLKDCREHIVENYNINTLYKEQWVPLLEDLQEEIVPETKEFIQKEELKNLLQGRPTKSLS